MFEKNKKKEIMEEMTFHGDAKAHKQNRKVKKG